MQMTASERWLITKTKSSVNESMPQQARLSERTTSELVTWVRMEIKSLTHYNQTWHTTAQIMSISWSCVATTIPDRWLMTNSRFLGSGLAERPRRRLGPTIFG